MLVDTIPDATQAYTNARQAAAYVPDTAQRFSVMYANILNSARVVNAQLTDEQEKELERLRSLLTTTKTVTDLVTGQPKQITEASPLAQAYTQYRQRYDAALLAYNAKKVAASTSSDPAVINDFAFNGQLYREQVDAAQAEWEGAGYKGDYEEVTAAIDALTRQSMAAWRMSLREDLKNSILSTPAGIAFPYTTVVPGDFALSDGWTKYTLDHTMINSRTTTARTDWQAGAAASVGLFTIGGEASGGSTNVTGDQQVDDFRMEFELCQAVIMRPGISNEFLTSRGWNLKKGEGWLFDELPCDGKRPPAGNLIGFAEQAVFICNLTITSSTFVSAFADHTANFTGHGAVGFGPIVLGGGGSHANTTVTSRLSNDRASLTVDGMQLIATVNYLFGKTPNLLDGLTDADLIGL